MLTLFKKDPVSTIHEKPIWAERLIPYLAADALENAADRNRASSEAQLLTRYFGNAEIFWREFFAMTATHYPHLGNDELARRFLVPAEFIPLTPIPRVARAEAGIEKAKADLERHEAEMAAALKEQDRYSAAMARRAALADLLAFVSENLNDLKAAVADRRAYIANHLFSGINVICGAGARERSLIDAYGAVVALDAAIADHPQQIARIEAQLKDATAEIDAIAKAKNNVRN